MKFKDPRRSVEWLAIDKAQRKNLAELYKTWWKTEYGQYVEKSESWFNLEKAIHEVLGVKIHTKEFHGKLVEILQSAEGGILEELKSYVSKYHRILNAVEHGHFHKGKDTSDERYLENGQPGF
jgi:nitrate reductase NapAB chaperone NapD